MLSAPLGKLTHVNNILSIKVVSAKDKDILLIDKLLSLPLHAQTKRDLLHRYLQRKPTHLQHNLPWHLLKDPLQRYEEEID
jgi:hypothetical protein